MGDAREGMAGDAWRRAFETRIEPRAEALHLTLIGELDLAARPQLEELTLAALLADRGPNVIIDLRPLTFLDASGLRALTALTTRLATAGARAQLIPAPPAVHRVFEITGLAKRFSFLAAGDPPGEDPPLP